MQPYHHHTVINNSTAITISITITIPSTSASLTTTPKSFWRCGEVGGLRAPCSNRQPILKGSVWAGGGSTDNVSYRPTDTSCKPTDTSYRPTDSSYRPTEQLQANQHQLQANRRHLQANRNQSQANRNQLQANRNHLRANQRQSWANRRQLPVPWQKRWRCKDLLMGYGYSKSEVGPFEPGSLLPRFGVGAPAGAAAP